MSQSHVEPPPLSEPHLRITQSPTLLMHPSHLHLVPFGTPLPVFQKTQDESWAYLGTYRLLCLMPETEAERELPDNKLTVFAWNEAGIFEELEETLPPPPPEERESREKCMQHAGVPQQQQQQKRGEEVAEEMVISPPQPQPEQQPTLVLPPTPPAALSDSVSSVSSIPSAYFPKETPVSIPTPEREQEDGCRGVTESYADVRMNDSHYSDFCEHVSDEDDDEDSDQWSVLSTGPVDRQWTVVFEEKDEVV